MPDNSRVVFVSDRSGTPGLWSIRVKDGKPSGEPELLKADFGHAEAMRFTRDGSLFYEVRLNLSDIYVAELDPATGKLTSAPKRINQRVGNSWGRVAWLPDSKSLSFWNRDPNSALVEHALATGEEREIWGGKTGHPGRGYTGWFPDGRTLMAGGGRPPDGQPMVFRRVDSRTGEEQANWKVGGLPLGATIAGYSPDLMTMYYSRKDETIPCDRNRCTYVMAARDIETGRDREVFRMKAIALRDSSISSDGRQMAFIAMDEHEQLLMAAPTAGGPPREIYRVSDNPPLRATAWTLDGGHILAFRGPAPRGAIWSFPTNGGTPEESQVQVRPAEMPAVSPDGTQIAFVGYNNSKEVWVMTGLFKDGTAAAKN